jgi:hypothetical protein
MYGSKQQKYDDDLLFKENSLRGELLSLCLLLARIEFVLLCAEGYCIE